MKVQIKLAQSAENNYFLRHHYERDLVTVIKPLLNQGIRS